MKRILLLAVLLIASVNTTFATFTCCDCKVTSHSTIFIRPPFQVSSPERLAHFRDDRVERKEDGWLGALQIVPLGGQAVKTDNIETYWGPDSQCKQVLLVNESLAAENTDILANHLNIYTVNGDFSSQVRFKFNHMYAGVGFYYQQEVYHTHTGRAIWFSVALPVMHVRNRVDICEKIINDGGGILPGPVSNQTQTLNCQECTECISGDTLPIPRVDSVTAAFDQPGWCFGKINSGKTMSTTKLSNAELRVGLQVVNNEHSHMESWAGINIATGNTPNGINVFEPIVGWNRHFGFFLGSTFGVHVYENEDWGLSVFSEFDFNIQYFFAHHEMRSFDLVDRPWSRYMQFYNSLAQAEIAATTGDASIATTLHTPGINLLTQWVKVKPGFNRTFNAAWDVLWRNFEFEAGYNFFAKQAECVEFPPVFPASAGLKRVGDEVFSGGLGTTDPGSFIDTNYFQANDGYLYPNFQVVGLTDLDIRSAEARTLLSHTIYASLAYDWDVCSYPILTSLGGSYEFAVDNTGVERWMAFGKVGVSF